MNDTLDYALAILAGFALGLIFFGGLWKTVHWALDANHPAVWLFGSFLLRMGLVFGGLLWLGKDDWRRLVAGLLGIMIARVVVTLMTRPGAAKRIPARIEAATGEGGSDAAES